MNEGYFFPFVLHDIIPYVFLTLPLSQAIRSEVSCVGHSARRDPFDESLGGGGGENIHLTRLEINKGGIGKSPYAEMLSSSPPPGMKQMQVRELLVQNLKLSIALTRYACHKAIEMVIIQILYLFLYLLCR